VIDSHDDDVQLALFEAGDLPGAGWIDCGEYRDHGNHHGCRAVILPVEEAGVRVSDDPSTHGFHKKDWIWLEEKLKNISK
jgi:hypothetical protein